MQPLQYKGFDITVTDKGIFTVSNDTWEASEDTLNELRRKIDAYLERAAKVKKEKCEPFTVLKEERYNAGNYVQHRVTSLAGVDRCGYDFWMVYNGKRTKEGLKYALVDCAENLAKIQEVKALTVRIREIEESYIKEDPLARAKQMGYEGEGKL